MGGKQIYSICGMCTVRCPIQVDVTGNRITSIQGNPHAAGIQGALCARGGAGGALVEDRRTAAISSDPHRQAGRRAVAAGKLGGGPGLHGRPAPGSDGRSTGRKRCCFPTGAVPSGICIRPSCGAWGPPTIPTTIRPAPGMSSTRRSRYSAPDAKTWSMTTKMPGTWSSRPAISSRRLTLKRSMT